MDGIEAAVKFEEGEDEDGGLSRLLADSAGLNPNQLCLDIPQREVNILNIKPSIIDY